MLTHVSRTLVPLALFCVCFVFFSAVSMVHAQESALTTREDIEALDSKNRYPVENIPAEANDIPGDFVVGPGKTDIVVSPGTAKVIEMTVTNRTGERKRFQITTEDMTGSKDSETSVVLLGNTKGPYSLRDYISIPHTTFELEHNERARIPVTVSIPQNAEPGGLYGSVLVETIALEAEPGDTGGAVPQSAIIARIGTLFFVTVPGDVAKEATLKQFGTIPEQTFFQGGPIKFGILYENNGSIHVAPYGELRIQNMFGEEVGSVQIDPWFVLPASIRLREISWDRSMLFGKYTATIEINRSYGDIIDSASYTFWVLPWKPLALVFIGVFLVIFLIRTFFKNFEFRRKV